MSARRIWRVESRTESEKTTGVARAAVAVRTKTSVSPPQRMALSLQAVCDRHQLVARLHHAAPRNSVDGFLIDTDAERRGEAVDFGRRRLGAMLREYAGADGIQLRRGDSRPDRRRVQGSVRNSESAASPAPTISQHKRWLLSVK